MRSVRPTLLFLTGCLAPIFAWAAEPLPRSILVLDQSDMRSPFHSAIFSGLRTTVNASHGAPVSIFAESLDLARFSGPAYEESLRAHLREKYSDKPIGVLVAVGSTALPRILRWREEFWPNTPVVFTMVDEAAAPKLGPWANVTGSFMRLRFADMVRTARVLVTDLKRVALVGDPFEVQTAFGHFKEEIPSATAGLEIIDLMGLPM